MAEYTREQCNGAIARTACDMVIALTKVMGLAHDKQKEFAGKADPACDSETDCAIRLRVAQEIIGRATDDIGAQG